MKKVCAIIPTLNEEKYIPELIDSLKANSYKNLEIVVVDDGSSDKTVEIAKAKGALVLVNKPGRRGPAFSWNRAARQTDADILLILGADFYIKDRYFVKKSVEAFDANTIAVKCAYKTIQDTLLEKIVTKPEGINFEPRFIRRDVFIELGGFPEIGVGEDQILTRKAEGYAKQKNKKIKIVKDAFILGHGVHSLSEMFRQAKWYGKSGPLLVKQFKGMEGIKHALWLYARMIYFLSFASFLLVPYSVFFFFTGIPFFLVFVSVIFSSRKNPWRIGRIFTFLVFGFGMLLGLLNYFFSFDSRAGY